MMLCVLESSSVKKKAAECVVEFRNPFYDCITAVEELPEPSIIVRRFEMEDRIPVATKSIEMG